MMHKDKSFSIEADSVGEIEVFVLNSILLPHRSIERENLKK